MKTSVFITSEHKRERERERERERTSAHQANHPAGIAQHAPEFLDEATSPVPAVAKGTTAGPCRITIRAPDHLSISKAYRWHKTLLLLFPGDLDEITGSYKQLA